MAATRHTMETSLRTTLAITLLGLSFTLAQPATAGIVKSPPSTTAGAVPGQPPIISGTPVTTATEGRLYQFQPTASDSDTQSLRFAVANRPKWARFDRSTGRLSGTPLAGSAGTYAGVRISVTDGASTVSLPAFTITVVREPVVKPPNTPATIAGTPPTSVQVGQVYDFTPTARDVDGDALTFSSANVPAWLNFDRTTGRLRGTPQTGQEGTYTDIVISVNDGTVFTFLPPFSITVTAAPVNRPPTISGTPTLAVEESKAYSFQPTASDPDGDALTFSASGLPAWLAFNTATGRVSGTPPAGSAGTYGGIVISVSDGKASASLASFTLTVTAPVNRPPTISGTPASAAVVGQAYAFQPTASDPEGQVLRFGIANKPAWAGFDIVTGRLSGTPGTSDVAVTSNIVISVSDGLASATLPAFSISVTGPVVGSASLTWTAPTQNVDGSALTNLAGYRIRYGTAPGTLDKLVSVVGAGITSATIEGLAAGTWYFAVSSYTNTGVESAPTGTVYKTIQ